MHLIEEDLKRYGLSIPFSRLLGEGIFVCNAFSFYNGVTPYNAFTGRQPPFLPDLQNLDFDQEGENTNGERKRRIRLSGIEAISQSTVVCKDQPGAQDTEHHRWQPPVQTRRLGQLPPTNSYQRRTRWLERTLPSGPQ